MTLRTSCVVLVLSGPWWPSAAGQDSPGPPVAGLRQESSESATSLIVVGPKEYEYANPSPDTVILEFPGWECNLSGAIPTESAVVRSIQVESVRRSDGTPVARLEVRVLSGVSHRVYARRGEVYLVLERPRPGALAQADPPNGPRPVAPADADRVDVAAPTATPTPAATATPADSLSRRSPGTVQEGVDPSIRTASRALQVSHRLVPGQVVVNVLADGPLHYEDFVLANPNRLVLDLLDVANHVPLHVLPVDQAPVQRVRVAQFSVSPRTVTRVVVDLLSPAPYRIVPNPEGLSVWVSRETRAVP